MDAAAASYNAQNKDMQRNRAQALFFNKRKAVKATRRIVLGSQTEVHEHECAATAEAYYLEKYNEVVTKEQI